MDKNPIWKLAEEVAEMLEIKIHPTWWYFLKDIYEEEEMINVFCNNNDLEDTGFEKSMTKRIIDALIKLFPNLETSQKTLTKSFVIEYSGIFHHFDIYKDFRI